MFVMYESTTCQNPFSNLSLHPYRLHQNPAEKVLFDPIAVQPSGSRVQFVASVISSMILIMNVFRDGVKCVKMHCQLPLL